MDKMKAETGVQLCDSDRFKCFVGCGVVVDRTRI